MKDNNWWLDIARGLHVGGSLKVSNPIDPANKSKGVLVYNTPLGWGMKDFRHGEHAYVPKGVVNLAEVSKALVESGKSDLPDFEAYSIASDAYEMQLATDYLLKRGIDPYVALRLADLGVSRDRLRLIYKLQDTSGFIGYIGRDITEKHKAKVVTYSTGGKRLKNAIFEVNTSRVWLVEDVNSAIKLHDSVGDTVISLNGTSICESGMLYLFDHDVSIWLDGDTAGVRGALKLFKDLQCIARSVNIIVGNGDPKDYTYKELGNVADKARNFKGKIEI